MHKNPNNRSRRLAVIVRQTDIETKCRKLHLKLGPLALLGQKVTN